MCSRRGSRRQQIAQIQRVGGTAAPQCGSCASAPPAKQVQRPCAGPQNDYRPLADLSALTAAAQEAWRS